MKLSKIINKAKNKVLWDGVPVTFWTKRVQEFSCCAVAQASSRTEPAKQLEVEMELMGLKTRRANFLEFKEGEERQGARFLWLAMFELIMKDAEDGIISLD